MLSTLVLRSLSICLMLLPIAFQAKCDGTAKTSHQVELYLSPSFTRTSLSHTDTPSSGCEFLMYEGGPEPETNSGQIQVGNWFIKKRDAIGPFGCNRVQSFLWRGAVQFDLSEITKHDSFVINAAVLSYEVLQSRPAAPGAPDVLTSCAAELLEGTLDPRLAPGDSVFPGSKVDTLAERGVPAGEILSSKSNLTSVVRNWANSPDRNFGFVLRSEEDDSFGSCVSVYYRIKLYVRYTYLTPATP